MFRNKPLRTYERKRAAVPWYTVSNASAIVRSNVLPDRGAALENQSSNVQDSTLDYDPFDTTFDRLAKDAIAHPVPQNIESNSSYLDSSSEEMRKNSDSNDLPIPMIVLDLESTGEHVTRKKRKKEEEKKKKMMPAKNQESIALKKGKTKQCGNLQNENAEPNTDYSLDMKAKRAKASDQKEDSKEKNINFRGKKRKKPKDISILKKCSILLKRINIQNKESINLSNECSSKEKNVSSDSFSNDKSAYYEKQISRSCSHFDKVNNEYSNSPTKDDKYLHQNYRSNDELHSNKNNKSASDLIKEISLINSGSITEIQLDSDQSDLVDIQINSVNERSVRQEYDERGEQIFKYPIVLLPRVQSERSIIKKFSSSTPIVSKLKRGKASFECSPIQNSVEENFDQSCLDLSNKTATKSVSAISPSFIKTNEKQVQRESPKLLSVTPEYKSSGLLFDDSETTGAATADLNRKSPEKGENSINEASMEIERESSNSLHLVYAENDDESEEESNDVQRDDEITSRHTCISRENNTNLGESGENNEPSFFDVSALGSSQSESLVAVQDSSNDPFTVSSSTDKNLSEYQDSSIIEDKVDDSEDKWDSKSYIGKSSAKTTLEIDQSEEQVSSYESLSDDKNSEIIRSVRMMDYSEKSINKIQDLSQLKERNLQPIVLLSPLISNETALKKNKNLTKIIEFDKTADYFDKCKREDDESLRLNLVHENKDDLKLESTVMNNSEEWPIIKRNEEINESVVDENYWKKSMQPVVLLTCLNDSIGVTKRRGRYRNWASKLSLISENKVDKYIIDEEENGINSDNQYESKIMEETRENSLKTSSSSSMMNLRTGQAQSVLSPPPPPSSSSPWDEASERANATFFFSQPNETINREDKVVFLKPGKSWARSLSILSQIHSEKDLEIHAVGKGRKWRESAHKLLLMQQRHHKGLIQSCVGKNEDSKEFAVFGGVQNSGSWIRSSNKTDIGRFSCRQLGITSPGRFIRRISIRVVPDSRNFDNIKDTSFLEAYGISSDEPEHNKSTQRCTLIAPRVSFDASSRIFIGTKSRDVVLVQCEQESSLPFEECYPESYLERCRKIGEGVYGEVFLYEKDSERRVIKIIPIEGEIKVNGERQKKFHEILSEIVIAKELHNLRYAQNSSTHSFIEVKNIRCARGKYPKTLIDLWKTFDDERNSENDCPSIFQDDQLYIVLELGHGGEDLEAYIFQNSAEAYAIFMQTAVALAVAEECLEFEHRDLHWGNLLISRTNEAHVDFKLNNRAISLNSKGVKVSVIDFTLSRMSYQGCSIFNDLSMDDDLFAAQGEYQFEVYRLMRSKLENNWQRFEPFTNILWLHYILDKMITAVRYRRQNTKIHKGHLAKLQILKDEILEYKSAADFVTNCSEVTRLRASRSSTSTTSSAQ